MVDHTNVKQGLAHPTQRLPAVLSRLLAVVGESTPLQDAFLLADDVLRQVQVALTKTFAGILQEAWQVSLH